MNPPPPPVLSVTWTWIASSFISSVREWIVPICSTVAIAHVVSRRQHSWYAGGPRDRAVRQIRRDRQRRGKEEEDEEDEGEVEEEARGSNRRASSPSMQSRQNASGLVSTNMIMMRTSPKGAARPRASARARRRRRARGGDDAARQGVGGGGRAVCAREDAVSFPLSGGVGFWIRGARRGRRENKVYILVNPDAARERGRAEDSRRGSAGRPTVLWGGGGRLTPHDRA